MGQSQKNLCGDGHCLVYNESCNLASLEKQQSQYNAVSWSFIGFVVVFVHIQILWLNKCSMHKEHIPRFVFIDNVANTFMSTQESENVIFFPLLEQSLIPQH